MKSMLLMCFLLIQPGLALAVQSIEGFPSIPFGVSFSEVKQSANNLKLQGIHSEQKGGFSIVHANQPEDIGDSSLTFVINQETDKLGLVIQRFNDLLTDRMLIKNFIKQYGQPMDETATKLIYDQIKADLPEGLQRVTIWADHGANAKSDSKTKVAVSRFIRVLYFGSHVSVEYLDTGIM